MAEEDRPQTAAAKTHPESWVDQHGDALYRYALMRLRDPASAEEAVQETFLAALRARDRFSGLSTERTWLVGILKHKIVDFIRKHSREKPPADGELLDRIEQDTFTDEGRWKSGQPAWQLDPGQNQERSEFRQVLGECLEELPPRQGEVFALRELDDLSSEEICKAMGITETNLWVMLHRARLRLRGCIQANWNAEDEVESPPDGGHDPGDSG
jgi:RNA polymerase sigma-70 factor (ECF subfamily)